MKFDPGSKTTGVAICIKGAVRGWICIMAFEIIHRSWLIKERMKTRNQRRRGRRSRKCRYRQPRFKNRARAKGWLSPSVKSMLHNTLKLALLWSKALPSQMSSIWVGDCKFDTQKMNNALISGKAYQQGTLFDYEVKEYLLQKWNYQCAYCQVRHVPFQKEHVVPKASGGTNRLSNLVLSCRPCNVKKGSLPIEAFLKGKPELLEKIREQMQAPLVDAAAMNVLRKSLPLQLRKVTGLPVHTSPGAQTKFNRVQQGYEKDHWIDAACVGPNGSSVDISGITHVYHIKSVGRGDRQMCAMDIRGFPRGKAKSVKRIHGFQTGNYVRLDLPKGKHAGIYKEVVSIRANGRFDIKFNDKRGNRVVITASHKYFTLLSRFDGYHYSRRAV